MGRRKGRYERRDKMWGGGGKGMRGGEIRCGEEGGDEG